MADDSCSVASVDLIDAGGAVAVTFANGERRRFHAIWLRDNAFDATTRAANGQKLVTVNQLPGNLRVSAADCSDDGGLSLTFWPEDLRADYPAAWLWSHAYDRPQPTDIGWLGDRVTLWDGTLQGTLNSHSFEAVRSSEVCEHGFLDDLVTCGLAVISGVPPEREGIFGLAALVGPVRETNYGRLFDVRAEVDPVNLAYSGLGLQAHTDNPYRDPVPTVQILHCLENSVEGGDSAVVDGFAVADRLRRGSPEMFHALAGHPARFRFNGDAVSDLRSKRPMIELGPDGEMLAVRFNNRSAAPLIDIPFDAMAGYYAAYRAFADLVDDPSMGVSFRLTPGMAFVVDNRRVLHARTEYTGTGTRWLQGCYCDMDAVLSRHAVLSLKRRESRP